jgi:hypothetical protein
VTRFVPRRSARPMHLPSCGTSAARMPGSSWAPTKPPPPPPAGETRRGRGGGPVRQRVCGSASLVCLKCSAQRRQLLVRLPLLAPAATHRKAIRAFRPALHIARDASLSNGAHHVLSDAGAGKRAAKLLRQLQPDERSGSPDLTETPNLRPSDSVRVGRGFGKPVLAARHKV